MSAAEDLYRQALALPEDERRELAERLLDTVDGDVEPAIAALGAPPGILYEDDPGLAEELERRAARPEQAIDGREAFAAARARIGR